MVFSDLSKNTTKEILSKRKVRLQRTLDQNGLDGIVVVPGPNMRYLTDIESDLLARPFMLLIPAVGGAHLLAPSLEAGPFSESPMNITIHPWTDSEGYLGAIKRTVGEARLAGNWGFEGRTPVAFLDKLMREAKFNFVDSDPLLNELRKVKDETEVGLLKKSAAVLSQAFESVPGLIREGMTEIELANLTTTLIYSKGAFKVEGMHVQCGSNAANPHSAPSQAKVRRGETVIFDVGSTFGGYYSDITRTFVLGDAKEVEEIYLHVLEAQEAGIKAARDRVAVGEVDATARGIIRKAGMGDYFIHRTGHGLGLALQEAPFIVEGGRELLGTNMCFTVEPGVYMPGKLGVRIEDDVLIEGRNPISITDVPKEFGWWR